jgi:hypothetical protein
LERVQVLLKFASLLPKGLQTGVQLLMLVLKAAQTHLLRTDPRFYPAIPFFLSRDLEVQFVLHLLGLHRLWQGRLGILSKAGHLF